MKLLLVTAFEYIHTGSHPDRVRCRFEDAYGKAWTLEEKVPVVTPHGFDENTPLPHPANVAVRIVNTYRDTRNREVVTVDTNAVWGIETEDGESVFDVFSFQIIESEP